MVWPVQASSTVRALRARERGRAGHRSYSAPLM